MLDNKLIESVVRLSEEKEQSLINIQFLQEALNNAYSKIELIEKKEVEDFCTILNKLMESVVIDETNEIKVFDETFGEKSQETIMAKYFVKAILDKAKELNIDAKKIALEIMNRIK
jgi:hypothetical protein